MFRGRDYISGLIGVVLFIFGLIPILESFKVLNFGITKILEATWFSASIPFVLAILGLYLAIESVEELFNSNSIGWISFIIGGIILILGLLLSLKAFGIGPGLFGIVISPIVYSILFLIEGVFLMIAMFMMEAF